MQITGHIILFFMPTDEETKIQIDTARELIELVDKYLNEYATKG